MNALCFQCSVPLTFCVVIRTMFFALTLWLLRHQVCYFILLIITYDLISLYASVYMFCRLGILNRNSPAIYSV